MGIIEKWHDRRITIGEDWRGEIASSLNDVDIILLLVSADFLASEYCYGIELKRALERHKAGDARVIPIIVRECLWTRSPFGKLQALPRDGKAIASWANRDEAWMDVALSFSRKAEIIQAAAGSFNIAQILCYHVCINGDVTSTVNIKTTLKTDVEKAIAILMEELTRKFGNSVRVFCSVGGPKDTTCVELLHELSEMEDGYYLLRK